MPDPDRETERREAGKEASVLLVLLSESPDDPALKARIDAWCARSALHREVWDRTCRTYRMIGGSPAVHAAEWRHLADRQAGRPPPSPATPQSIAAYWRGAPPARRLLATAALAVVACLATAVAPTAYLRLSADVATMTAEVRTVDLDDGSRVRLAPRSALDIAFTKDERQVRLIQGAAFFEVAPNARRPFRVVAGNVIATVLGTAFEVDTRDGSAAVTVRHGHVRVDDPTATPPLSANLLAGERVSVRSHRLDRGTTRPDDIGDWIDGQYVARDRPIGEIVDRLRDYYDGAIVVQDSAFASRLVSGVYELGDPETTLRNLASAHDAVVRRISPWLLLVTAR